MQIHLSTTPPPKIISLKFRTKIKVSFKNGTRNLPIIKVGISRRIVRMSLMRNRRRIISRRNKLVIYKMLLIPYRNILLIRTTIMDFMIQIHPLIMKVLGKPINSLGKMGSRVEMNFIMKRRMTNRLL